MDRNHLYLFANDHPEGIDDIEWKQCLGNVNRRFNITRKQVVGFRTGADLFRMNRKEKPVQ